MPEGFWIKFGKKGNKLLFAGQIPLHDPEDPWKEAKRLTENVPDKTFLLVLGLGLGYHIDLLQKKGCKVLVFEPSKEIVEICKKEGVISNWKNIIVLSDEEALKSALESMESVPVLVHPGSARIYGKLFKKLIADIQKILWMKETSKKTLKKFERHRLLNKKINLSKKYRKLKIKKLNVPVLIAGAGPSLQWLLKREDAKQLLQRCVFLAVDTALPALRKRNLEPDAVVSVDPQPDNALHLTGWRKTVLAEVGAFPSFENPVLFQSESPAWKDLPFLPAGGNVSYAAVEIALEMKANPLILTGVDFEIKSEPYCEGTVYEDRWVTTCNAFLNYTTLKFLASSGKKELLEMYSSFMESKLKGKNVFKTGGRLCIPFFGENEVEKIKKLPLLNKEEADDWFTQD